MHVSRTCGYCFIGAGAPAGEDSLNKGLSPSASAAIGLQLVWGMGMAEGQSSALLKNPQEPARVRRARWRLLANLVRLAEPVMALLGLVWLLLLVIEFTQGVTPALANANRAIWIVFIIDFAAEFLVAPSKSLYLRRHWLVLLSLALPALRVARAARIVRVARAARSVRGVRLLRTLTSMNRAMSSLRMTMSRRGFGYVSGLTVIVTLGGAAAMFAFENGVADPYGLHDYATALWWTAMIMTTMGSAYWPQTPEGRMLCVVLSLYAFAVFGYVTATLASFFVSRDVPDRDGH